MNRLVVVAALTSAVACTPSQKPEPIAQAAPSPAAPVHAPAAAAAQSDLLAPEVVLDKLHDLDAQLIEAGKLAEKTAHGTRVKKLAKTIVSARTKADADLVTLASKLSVTLKDPAQLPLPADDKAELAARHTAFASLAAKNGDAFDEGFLGSVDVALKSELALLAQVDSKASNPDLKALAQKLQPVVTAREEVAAHDLKLAGHAKSGG